jgi:hypothetical protein
MVVVLAAGTERHEHALESLEAGYVVAMYDGNVVPALRSSSGGGVGSASRFFRYVTPGGNP